MALTFADLKDRLKQLDEVTLLEILDISAEELVEALEPLIYARQDHLALLFEEEDETNRSGE